MLFTNTHDHLTSESFFGHFKSVIEQINLNPKIVLCQRWSLYQSPLDCKNEILKRASFWFFDNDKVTIFDTANPCHSFYDMNISELRDNIAIGKIEFSGYYWPHSAIFWNDENESKQAQLVDNFIHSVIKNEMGFVLDIEHQILTIKYKGDDYFFRPSN